MNIAMTRWQEDTAVLDDLRTHLNDKLNVAEGRLKLEKGVHTRIQKISLVKGPVALANHLEVLIKETGQECFLSLQQSKSNLPEYYEQVADFKRQVKCLTSKISDLQNTFGSHDCNYKKTAQRYSELYNLANKLFGQVKEYKSSLSKPPSDQRPIKHIDYNERSTPESIRWKHPNRVPIAETVAAAKKALALTPKPRPLYMRCLSVIAGGLLAIPALFGVGLLTALKIILWNPAEWLIRGEIRTLSPVIISDVIISRLIEDAIWTPSIRQRHQMAFQNFTTQLLHRPQITEEVAEAFAQLAPHANLLDLKDAILASEDITELAPFLEEDKRPGAIPLTTYLDLMERLSKKHNFKLKTLHRVSNLYKRHNDILLTPKCGLKEGQSIENYLDEDFEGLKGDVIKPHCVNPYITPKALETLFKAVSSSPTCREIALSDSLAELQPVRNFLTQHSYRLKEDGKYKKIYRR